MGRRLEYGRGSARDPDARSGPIERAVNKALQAVGRAETEALERAERSVKMLKGSLRAGKDNR